MSELEAELRRLADAASKSFDVEKSDVVRGAMLGARIAYREAADLARDHEAKHRDGWMPIESAPRDGTALLAWRPGLLWPVAAQWADDDQRWELCWNWDAIHPTHWRPLPEPPVAA